MVARGLQRADEFTFDAIARRWQELLFERLPNLARDSKTRLGPGKPIWLRQMSGRKRWRLPARQGEQRTGTVPQERTRWNPETDGGAEGDRTLDLRIANATLSQLSYRPTRGRAL
jgi:hypothetical protein